jgi:hypothetical protein
MAGSARFGFFHLSHGEMLAISQVEDGIVADLAVAVFLQVFFMAEYDRFRIFKAELDIFCLDCSGADCH